MNKFSFLADDIYEDFIHNEKARNHGVLFLNFQVTMVKFFHLLIKMLVYYLSEFSGQIPSKESHE